jgi:hypothetical protein
MVLLSKEVAGSLYNADLYWQLVDAGVEHGIATYISANPRMGVYRLLECRSRARRTWKCISNDSAENRKLFTRWFQKIRRLVLLWTSQNTSTSQPNDRPVSDVCGIEADTTPDPEMHTVSE